MIVAPDPRDPRLIPVPAENPAPCRALFPAHTVHPRVRRTLRLPSIVAKQARFIPACAENTSHAGSRSGHSPVHARVCGEHLSTCTMRASCIGSSPRVRRTQCRLVAAATFCRFIPACAEKRRPIIHSRDVASKSGRPQAKSTTMSPASPVSSAGLIHEVCLDSLRTGSQASFRRLNADDAITPPPERT